MRVGLHLAILKRYHKIYISYSLRESCIIFKIRKDILDMSWISHPLFLRLCILFNSDAALYVWNRSIIRCIFLKISQIPRFLYVNHIDNISVWSHGKSEKFIRKIFNSCLSLFHRIKYLLLTYHKRYTTSVNSIALLLNLL